MRHRAGRRQNRYGRARASAFHALVRILCTAGTHVQMTFGTGPPIPPDDVLHPSDLAVLITFWPLKRAVAAPCETAETWLGWPLPSKNEPPSRKSRSSQMATQAFQNSGVRIW